MNLIHMLLLAIPISTSAEHKLFKLKKKSVELNCNDIKCPAVEKPICVRLKSKNEFAKKSTYMLLINSCELSYMKCHEDVKAQIVNIKYCDHSHLTQRDKTKTGSKRVKRDTRNNDGEKTFKKKVFGDIDFSKAIIKPLLTHGVDNSKPSKNTKPEEGHSVDGIFQDSSPEKPHQEPKEKPKQGVKTESIFKENMFDKNIFGNIFANTGAKGINVQGRSHSKFTGTNENKRPSLRTLKKNNKHPHILRSSDKNETQTSNGPVFFVTKLNNPIFDPYIFGSNTGNKTDDYVDYSAPQFGSPENDGEKGLKNPSIESVEDRENHTKTDKPNKSPQTLLGKKKEGLKRPESDDSSNDEDGVVLEGEPDQIAHSHGKEKDKRPPKKKPTPLTKDVSDHEVIEEVMDEDKEHSKNKMKYEEDCPTSCPGTNVMVCGKCTHGVYRTFLSVCQLRMFNCHHPNEDMQLISRYPCVASAAYLSSNNKMDLMPDDNVVVDPNDDDLVLRFINCRNKGLYGGDEDMNPPYSGAAVFKKRCYNSNNMKKRLESWDAMYAY